MTGIKLTTIIHLKGVSGLDNKHKLIQKIAKEIDGHHGITEDEVINNVLQDYEDNDQVTRNDVIEILKDWYTKVWIAKPKYAILKLHLYPNTLMVNEVELIHDFANGIFKK